MTRKRSVDRIRSVVMMVALAAVAPGSVAGQWAADAGAASWSTQTRLVGPVLPIVSPAGALALHGRAGRMPEPLAAVQVVPPSHRHTATGAIIGGLAAGLFVAQDMLRKPEQCRGSGRYGERCAWVLAGSVAGGALLGATVGYFLRHEGEG